MAELATNTSPFRCRWIATGTEMRLEHWTYAICLRCRNQQRVVSEDECGRCACWELPTDGAHRSAAVPGGHEGRRFPSVM